MQPAVKIAQRGAEEQAPHERKRRVADVAVFPWHGARSDATAKPVAHHEIMTGPQRLDKTRQVGEIIAAVGVTHEHVTTQGGRDAAAQGAAVTLGGNGYHAGPRCRGHSLRAVGAAVVGHDDFTGDAVFL